MMRRMSSSQWARSTVIWPSKTTRRCRVPVKTAVLFFPELGQPVYGCVQHSCDPVFLSSNARGSVR